MKQLALIALLAATPLAAQEAPQQAPPQDEGFDLMEQGMLLLFKGLQSELEPTLEELSEALDDIGPMARQLTAMIGDIRNYEAPELLENGDIIIRRKPGAPAVPAPWPYPDPGLEPRPGTADEIEI